MVFKNRRVLLHDYTPPRLPCRERELKELKKRFEPVLREGINVRIHVYGKVGTGKTVLYKWLGCWEAKLGNDIRSNLIASASSSEPKWLL